MNELNSHSWHVMRRRFAIALSGVLLGAMLPALLDCQQLASAQTLAEVPSSDPHSSAPQSPGPAELSDDELQKAIARWSEQLQSRSFAAREQASEKLFQLGYKALPSLRSLRGKMTESESRERLSKIIKALSSDDLKLRIERFLQGDDSQLENWSYLRKWFDDSPRVRELFVDLYQEYPEVVMSLNGSEAELSSALISLRRKLDLTLAMRMVPERIDMIALLLLMVTPEFDPDGDYDFLMARALDAYSVKNFRQDKVLGEPLVRLVAAWMPQSGLAYREQVLVIALKWKMDIGLSMATTTLQRDPPPTLLARCIQVIARQGLPSDARLLEPYLKDQRVVYPSQLLGRKRHDILVCDVAAAGIAYLANVPVTEIGFTESVKHEVFGFLYEALMIDLPKNEGQPNAMPDQPGLQVPAGDDEGDDPNGIGGLRFNQDLLRAIQEQNKRKISPEALAKARAEIRQKALKLLPPSQ